MLSPRPHVLCPLQDEEGAAIEETMAAASTAVLPTSFMPLGVCGCVV